MSYFKDIIPSKFHYFTKFKELTEIDFKIIIAMLNGGPDSPRNASRIARELKLLQQTVNYRVQRLDKGDLVRFRATINESLLGLENYAVVATVKPGLAYDNKEGTAINAGTFMTCYPVWRLLSSACGGNASGFFVLYAIPPKLKDLKAFFGRLKAIGCIEKIDEFCRVTQSHYNTPSLGSYLTIRRTAVQDQTATFDWEKWAYRCNETERAPIPENSPAENQTHFTYEDLMILFHLEKNAREKFVEIGKSIGEPSSEVKKRYEEILNRHLIINCRAEIYPIDPVSSLHLTLKLSFTSNSGFRMFVSHLNEVPYPVFYQKAIDKDVLFMHTMIPCHEHFHFYNSLGLLNKLYGIIKNVNLYVGNYYSELNNIALFEAFSKDENKWMFSKDIMFQTLSRLIDESKFKF
jgi:DNA-binding Lrp family transcriptional regulator